MSTFLDRLKAEKTELDERLEKLRAFQSSAGFGSIEPVQMSLLNIQEAAMSAYSQCLAERLAWLWWKDAADRAMAGDHN